MIFSNPKLHVYFGTKKPWQPEAWQDSEFFLLLGVGQVSPDFWAISPEDAIHKNYEEGDAYPFFLGPRHPLKEGGLAHTILNKKRGSSKKRDEISSLLGSSKMHFTTSSSRWREPSQKTPSIHPNVQSIFRVKIGTLRKTRWSGCARPDVGQEYGILGRRLRWIFWFLPFSPGFLCNLVRTLKIGQKSISFAWRPFLVSSFSAPQNSDKNSDNNSDKIQTNFQTKFRHVCIDQNVRQNADKVETNFSQNSDKNSNFREIQTKIQTQIQTRIRTKFRPKLEWSSGSLRGVWLRGAWIRLKLRRWEFRNQGFRSQGFRKQGFQGRRNPHWDSPRDRDFQSQGFRSQGFRRQGFRKQGFRSWGFRKWAASGPPYFRHPLGSLWYMRAGYLSGGVSFGETTLLWSEASRF